MKKKYVVLFIITPFAVFLDQVTKFIVAVTFHLHQSIPVIRNYFNITYVRNRGAAFGFLSDLHPDLRTPFFISISILAIIIILLIIRKLKDAQILLSVSLSLILGGAIGNFIDRIRLGFVIDFLDLHWKQYHWPAFNIADVAITIGVILLFFDMIFTKDGAK